MATSLMIVAACATDMSPPATSPPAMSAPVIAAASNRLRSIIAALLHCAALWGTLNHFESAAAVALKCLPIASFL